MTVPGSIRRPAFLYYGSKFRLAKHYPQPKHDLIIEPFAGAAGYSLRHFQKNVILIDAYDVICGVWRYLIRTTPEEILRLPLLEHRDQTIDDLHLDCIEARHLIGFWLNSACASPVKSLSSWGKSKTFGDFGHTDAWRNRPDNQFWTDRTRAHVADVAHKVKHWHVECGTYVDIEHDWDVSATWFIDPPYQNAGKHYKHSSNGIDYTHLAAFARAQWSGNRL